MIALCFAILLGVSPVQAATGGHNPPALPKNIRQEDRIGLEMVEDLLSQSRFGEADAKLKLIAVPATSKIYIDWGPVPSTLRQTYKAAADEAVRSWQDALAGAVQF